ncbi:MAG: diguanylate cyclase [Candidatus Riflebacteria bacterium]|nr:diguanylate cyclase [Candidatus Riflebacteria bacterium]
MRKSRNYNLNLYLFSNLFLVVLLVFAIWKGDFWQEANVKLPGILTFLVIINTFLIFRESLKSLSHSPAEIKYSGESFSLSSLRKFLSDRASVDETLPREILSEFLEITGDEASALYIYEDKGAFALMASAGTLPSQLAASRFFLSDGKVIFKHPGGLGEEQAFSWDTPLTGITFISSITRFKAKIYPLRGVANLRGFWLNIMPARASKRLRFDREWLAVYLEGIISLVYVHIRSAAGLSIDMKTGLIRHDSFKQTFETEVERSERYSQNMTLMLLRIAGFENFIPTVKDRVQSSIASALRDSLRKLDFMFLWNSPGVFAAILTETNNDVARMVAQRIIVAFKKHLNLVSREINDFPECCIHIGTATYPADSTHGEGLLDKATDALDASYRKRIPYQCFGELVTGGGEKAPEPEKFDKPQ